MWGRATLKKICRGSCSNKTAGAPRNGCACCVVPQSSGPHFELHRRVAQRVRQVQVALGDERGPQGGTLLAQLLNHLCNTGTGAEITTRPVTARSSPQTFALTIRFAKDEGECALRK